MPSIQAHELTTFATRLLAAGGLTDDEASLVAESLVGSNLRGYDSHGVMRIPHYIKLIREGSICSGAALKVVRDLPSVMVTDGQWGIGQVQATRLLEHLLRKASHQGVAVGTIIHCGHIGRLGEYCEMAAAQGYVSMLMVNSHGAVVRMSPPGGAAPRLSTNPIAFGAPHQDSPLIADFSTSATAEGKVRVKKIAGESVPEGWLLDSNGNPTTDPNSLYGDPPGSIRPMGGDQAYKGFALGLMIEILTGALSGGVTARPEPYPKLGNCVYMMVLNPEQFGGSEHFAREVEQLLAYVRSCPLAPGHERIVLPGDPERASLNKKEQTGLTFDQPNWNQLVNLAEELNVAIPST